MPSRLTLEFEAENHPSFFGGSRRHNSEIEIGAYSGVFLIGPASEVGAYLFPALQKSDFKVELIDGIMKLYAALWMARGSDCRNYPQ